MQHTDNQRHTTDNLCVVPQFVKSEAGRLPKPGRDKGMRQAVAAWLREGMAAASAEGGSVSQSALAKRSGVSRETINNLLHARVDSQPDTLHKLAVALGIPLPGGGRPVVREVGAGPYTPSRDTGKAARYFRGVMRELSADFGTDEMITIERAAGYMQALWNYAVEECPALESDLGPGAG